MKINCTTKYLMLLLTMTTTCFTADRLHAQSTQEGTAVADIQLEPASKKDSAWDAEQLAKYIKSTKGEANEFGAIVRSATERLKAKPSDALASAWIAMAQSVQAGSAFQSGDFQTGMKLWSEAIDALKAADKLGKKQPLVQLRVASTALEAWNHDPDPTNKQMLGQLGLDSVMRLARHNPKCWTDTTEARRVHLLKAAKVVAETYDGSNAQRKLLESALQAAGIDPNAQSTKASKRKPTKRFDELVREDFFAGMFDGEQELFDGAMKFCEETLAKQPGHVEAKVWIGCGKVWQASQAYENGDDETGKRLFDEGIVMMNEAVSAAPDHIGVLIPRGATLLGLGRQAEIDPSLRYSLLHLGVYDYERTYEIQKPYFDRLSEHARHELLLGLADGWHQLGNKQRVKKFADIVLADGDSDSFDVATAYATNKLTPELLKGRACSGCH